MVSCFSCSSTKPLHNIFSEMTLVCIDRGMFERSVEHKRVEYHFYLSLFPLCLLPISLLPIPLFPFRLLNIINIKKVIKVNF